MTRKPAPPRPASARPVPPRQPDPSAAWLQEGLAHHRAGRLAEAEALYRRILTLHPDHPDTLNLLGLAAYQSDRAEAALKLFDRALTKAPRSAEYHNNRGLALDKLERAAEAETSYRRALALKPDHPDTTVNLANLLRAQGRPAEAESLLRKLLARSPAFASARNALALVLKDQDRLAEALEQADRALTLRRNFAEALLNRGLILDALDRTDEAAEAYRAAIALQPRRSVPHVRLGQILLKRKDLDRAAAAFRQALACDPQSAAGHYGLGNALMLKIELSEAIRQFRKVLEIDPEHIDALHNLGHALLQTGDTEAAIATLRRAADIRVEKRHASFSEYLLALNYDDRLTAAEVAGEHARIGRIYAQETSPRRSATPLLGRRLRVGYVSPDFRLHSCAFFMEPLLAAHDRNAVEVFCYAAVKHPDDVTERLKAVAEHWRDIKDLSDEDAARRVVDDGVDILIDLAGHTGGTRLGVFGLRPAPVQASWLGYPNMTGLPAIPYRLTDGWADPPGAADRLHAGRLIRLAGGFLCYAPPSSAPAVGPVPLERNGRLTFGSFNNASKIGGRTIACWAAILNRVDGSRLLLKSRQFQDAGTRTRFAGLFAEHGVEADRLAMLPHLPDVDTALGAYGDIDIALDPFPYNGTTTTCEALWMGVPVVTLVGDRHAARVGYSLLQAVGVSELAADSEEGYVALAADLAANRERLAAYRQSLRERVAASPLCDRARFARDMEAAFREMWADACSGHAAAATA